MVVGVSLSVVEVVVSVRWSIVEVVGVMLSAMEIVRGVRLFAAEVVVDMRLSTVGDGRAGHEVVMSVMGVSMLLVVDGSVAIVETILKNTKC